MTGYEINNKLEELSFGYLFETTLYYDFGKKFEYHIDKYDINWALIKRWRNMETYQVEKEINNLYDSDETSIGNYYYNYLKDFYENDARDKYIELGV